MKKLSILLFLFVSLATQATTYHIDANGNDTTGVGTKDNPWRSFYKASIVAIRRGDTIIVAAGHYLENHECMIAPGVSLEGVDSAQTVLYSNNAAHHYNRGVLNFYSGTVGINGNQHVKNIGFDGMAIAGDRAIYVDNRNNITIRNCNFKDWKYNPVYWLGAQHFESYTQPAVYCTGNKFIKNRVTNSSAYGPASGLWFSGQDGFVIDSCYLEQVTRVCGVGGDIVSGQTNKRWRITNSSFIKSRQIGTYWNFALEVRWNYGDCLLYNNTISGSCDLPYLYNEGYTNSIIIRKNTFGFDTPVSDARNYALTLEGFNYHVLIDSNIFKNISSGVSFTSGVGIDVIHDNITIRRNLFYNIGTLTNAEGWAIYLIGGGSHPASTFKNFYIDNNTMKGLGSGKTVAGVYVADNNTTKNIYIRNNIIDSFVRPVNFSNSISQTHSCDSIYIQNNDFWANDANNIYYYNSSPANLHISNNTKFSPKFSGSADFHLKYESPAIDAGMDIGLPYSGRAPDIGAYEIIK